MFRMPSPVFNAEGGGSATAASDTGAAGASAVAATGGAPASAAPWYAPFNLDEPSVRFIEDRKFNDMGTLLKSAQEADRVARSRNVLEKPDPANVKEWNGWSELGWKPKFDEYALKRPQTPESFAYMPGFEDAVRKIAHENRVPLGAAQALLDGLTDYAVKEVDAMDAKGIRANADLANKLKADWGGNYDRNVEMARRAARHLGVGIEEQGELEAVMGSARLLALFQKIGTAIGEDTLVTSAGSALPENVETLRAELRRLQSDKDFMASLKNSRAPNHRDVVEQRQALIAKIAEIELRQPKR